MKKALLAFIVTFFAGWIGAVIGLEFLNGHTEFGPIIAISVMGTFIIYFNDRSKSK